MNRLGIVAHVLAKRWDNQLPSLWCMTSFEAKQNLSIFENELLKLKNVTLFVAVLKSNFFSKF